MASSKGFISGTVQEIINEADINRTTFYYHYKDKLDLIEEVEFEILEGLIQDLVIPMMG
ncbi:TetR/AcrR family transcriptional regulator [Bacillus sp. AFS017336]|uniref:TetR/AcrR family transcriptional regulator n=1 Tax=Bacillus sp. AFS017336 TaxID=2033489 RepID=UPI0035A03265